MLTLVTKHVCCYLPGKCPGFFATCRHAKLLVGKNPRIIRLGQTKASSKAEGSKEAEEKMLQETPGPLNVLKLQPNSLCCFPTNTMNLTREWHSGTDCWCPLKVPEKNVGLFPKDTRFNREHRASSHLVIGSLGFFVPISLPSKCRQKSIIHQPDFFFYYLGPQID